MSIQLLPGRPGKATIRDALHDISSQSWSVTSFQGE